MIDLSLKATKRARVGDYIEIHLITASDSDKRQIHSSIHAIIRWDPVILELKPDLTYQRGPDKWAEAAFKDDPWRANRELDDGDALWVMLSAVNTKIFAPPRGHKVTTFMFKALAPGYTEVSFIKRFFKRPLPPLYTKVFGDLPINSNVTGTLGPPAEIVIRRAKR